MSDFDYAAIYAEDFFRNADGMGEWERKKLKYGDALAAIGYAFGFRSLNEVRVALSFSGVGRSVEEDGLDASAQITRLVAAQTRSPRGVLEIGAGRGEVSVAFAHLGYSVQAIEPSPGAAAWLSRTSEQLFSVALPSSLRLLNAPVHEVLAQVDWSAVDTVVMVESLEHILAEDFEPVYCAMRDHLRVAGGRFVVTNWVDYHPIDVGWYATPDVHCRLVDDALYDAWSKDARSVVYREGSHLVLDY